MCARAFSRFFMVVIACLHGCVTSVGAAEPPCWVMEITKRGKGKILGDWGERYSLFPF